MIRRARGLAAIAACALALGACNLIAGLTEDFSIAPDGDGSIAPGVEAGEDVSTKDSTVAEDGSAMDAPADGSLPDTAKALSFCASQDAANVVFCTDFDTAPDAAPFGWDSVAKYSTAD